MARAQGARAQMALGFEDTYGTPPAADSFWKVPFVSSTLGSQQALLESDVLGVGRDPIDPMLDAVTADGDVVVPLDRNSMGVWLKLLLGEPTSMSSFHDFPAGEWDLPSASIEIGMPEVPHYAMISGVKANSLQLNLQRTGLLTATMGLMAQKEVAASSTAAGTLTELPFERVRAWEGTVQKDGSALGNVVSAQINYTNNLDAIDTLEGSPNIAGADPSRAALTGQIVMRFADQVMYDEAVAGDPLELVFSLPISSAALTISAHRAFLSKPRIPIEGPGGIQVTFDWQAAQAVSGAAEGKMAAFNLITDASVTSFDNPGA